MQTPSKWKDSTQKLSRCWPLVARTLCPNRCWGNDVQVEVVFADDSHAYRIYPSATHNSAIRKSLDNVQCELHKWGEANQVTFDAARESQHVLSTSDPEGNSFKLLGVPFDTGLSMANVVSELVSSAGWKLKTILRTRRFYTDADLIVL